MRILATLTFCLWIAFSAHAQGVVSSPVTVLQVSPTALANGKLTDTNSMSDGTVVTFTTATAVNGAAIAAYDPTVFAITTGGTATLDDGFTEYYFSGTGTIATYTVKLPPNPGDGQVARLVLPIGLTAITLLTVENGAGTAVTCNSCSLVVFGASPIFHYRAAIGWTQISKG